MQFHLVTFLGVKGSGGGEGESQEEGFIVVYQSSCRKFIRLLHVHV